MSSFITTGNVTTFWLLVAFCGILFALITRAKQGTKLPFIRRVSGLDAIDEAIGRATEMGRPIFFSPGIGDLQNAQTLAAFYVLGYVAGTAARYDTRIIVANRNANVHPITEDTVKGAYLTVGKPDAFNPGDIQFLSDNQWGYASGVQGLLRREQAAASILFGAFWAESLLFAEVAQQLGAIQVAATANNAQLPFFVASCDYSLIGEEMYAASAYLSKEPILMGNLIGLDWGKMFAAAIILIGALARTFDNTFLVELFRK